MRGTRKRGADAVPVVLPSGGVEGAPGGAVVDRLALAEQSGGIRGAQPLVGNQPRADLGPEGPGSRTRHAGEVEILGQTADFADFRRAAVGPQARRIPDRKIQESGLRCRLSSAVGAAREELLVPVVGPVPRDA